MARISELDRLEIVDRHLAHWLQAEGGGVLLLVPGYGRAELQGQRDEYLTMQHSIGQLEMSLDVALATRDTLWGISPEDGHGAWFRLKLFKALVLARLGARHVLSRTVPNLGTITPQNYLDILQRFLDHWERVNAALAPAPLTLGAFTIADLQTLAANLQGKILESDTLQATLRIRRQEREQLFGDEPEDIREETSIVARLTLYHAIVAATFPNQPLADSLPDIFPSVAPTGVTTFVFNGRVLAEDELKVWYTPPSPARPSAVSLVLREGAAEFSSPVLSTSPDSTPVHTFRGVTLSGELDEVELRNGSGSTIARGTRDPSLPEPA